MSTINPRGSTYNRLPESQGHIYLGQDNRYYLNVKGQIVDVDIFVRSTMLEKVKTNDMTLSEMPVWKKRIHDLVFHTGAVKIRDDGFHLRLTLGKMMAIISFDTNNTYRVEILDGNSCEDVDFFVMEDFHMLRDWLYRKFGIKFDVEVGMVEVS